MMQGGAMDWRDEWNPRMSMSLTCTKGLLNPAGQNNCFLNSAVQVLWHLDVFRRSFRLLSGHACMGNSCIFCALKVIFTQFQYSDQTCLPPDALRKALAKSFAGQHRFQMGHMDDAAECFENILMRMHTHMAHAEPEDFCGAPHCISHQKFAMNIIEQVVCPCGATSEPHSFQQTVYYVSATALVAEAKGLEAPGAAPANGAARFGQIIKRANSDGEIRSCPSDCGKKVGVVRNLMNFPDVLSVGLIWDSDRTDLEHIKDVIRCIGTSIQLQDVFHTVVGEQQAPSPLQLVGLVCYYGKHYTTFFFHSKKQKWIYFDDATVKEMGSSWQMVTEKCCRGHFQPLLLLYSSRDSEPIKTATAPPTITKLPGYQNYHSEDAGGNHSLSREPKKEPRPTYVNYKNMRRSMTPNPEQGRRSPECLPIQRRAITPNPEWSYKGHYNSEEDITQQADSAHFRQPSYLTAMDTVDYGSNQQFQNNRPYGTMPASVDGYSYNHPRDTQARVPSRAGSQSSISYQNQQNAMPRPQQSKSGPRYNGAVQAGQITHSQQAHGPVSNSRVGGQYVDQHGSRDNLGPNSQVSSSNGHSGNGQMQYNSGNPNVGNGAEHWNQPAADRLRQVQKVNRRNSSSSYSSHQQEESPYLSLEQFQQKRLQNSNQTQGANDFKARNNSTNNSSYQNAAAPYQSDGNNTAVPNHGFHNAGAPSRSRPVSANPYTQREHIAPAQPARPGSSQMSRVASKNDTEYVSHSDIMKKKTTITTKPQQSMAAAASMYNKNSTDDETDMYISRKAVESILKMQNKMAPKVPPKHALPMRQDSFTSYSSSDSGRNTFNDALRVDIPADNVSIGSNMSKSDSGYRSGDHHSTCSNGSSTESPHMDSGRVHSQKMYPKRIAGHGNLEYKDRHHSSSDSLDSAQSGHSSRTITNLSCASLGHIPENGPVVGVAKTLPKRSSEVDKSAMYSEDAECEDACFRAEDLLQKAQQREKSGDIAAALVFCQKAIGQLQLVDSMTHISPKMRNHAHVKQNVVVMKTRGLHVRMTQRQDSGHSSDLSEDHISLSSMSTEPSDVDGMVGHATEHVKGRQYAGVYTQHYNSQCSSDSGYSTTTDDQLPRRKKIAHSSTESTLYESSKEKDLGIYATLPRKGTIKAAMRNQMKSTEMPDSYQSGDMQLKPRHRSDSEGSIANLSTAGNHSRQSSASSTRMSKEEINQHLSEYFVRTKHDKEAKKVASENKKFHKMLFNDMISMQKRQMNFKDGKQPVPVPPPVVPSSKGHVEAIQYVDHDQLHKMNNPSLFDFLPNGAFHHSRESSASSSHTLKAHSRDNSLSSQDRDVHPHQKMHRGRSPLSHTQSNELPSNVTDRRLHNFPVSSIHPFPGAPPLTDPGGKQRNPNYKAHPATNEAFEEQGAPRISRSQSVDNALLKKVQDGWAYEAAGDINQDWEESDFNHRKAEASVTCPLSPGPAPPPRPDKKHIEHILSFRTENNNTPVPTPAKIPPPVAAKPKLKPQVPRRTTSLQNLLALDDESPAFQEDEPFPPPPPESELLVNQLNAYASDFAAEAFVGDDLDSSSSSQYADYHHSARQPSNFAAADFPDADSDSVMSAQLANLPLPEPKKVIKSLLKKKNKKSRNMLTKSVTFSDNISLIVEKDDLETPEMDYVAYVQSLLANRGKGTLIKATSNPELAKPKYSNQREAEEKKTGYDSDFDEDTSDSEESVDQGVSKSLRCNLCRKHTVNHNEMYCNDCQFYMSKFQQR